MTLYEITEEILILLNKIDNTVSNIPSGGEENKAQLLSLLEKDFDQKIIAYAKIKKNLDAEQTELAEEIKRLQDRKKANAARIEAINLSMTEAMLAVNKNAVHGPLFDIVLKALSPKLIVDDESKVPDGFFIPAKPKLDKKALNKWALDHEVDEFGHYEPNFSLMIK